MDDLEIINVTDEDELAVDGNNEDEVNILEDIVVDDNVYVSDTVIDDLPDIIEAGQFYIYVPIASVNNKGIAQYNNEHFVVENGVVYVKLSPKAIADKNGEDITDTYQRKDNMIEQWISELTGKYPSATLVRSSLDQILLNKGKGVFVFTTEEDFMDWISGLKHTDTTGKVIENLMIGDDILIIGSKTSYWCKSKNTPLTINDFEPYNEDFWGHIKGDITLQNDLIELFDNIEVEINDVNTKIVNINNKIPIQASENNQLADKDFVNSSIETATATFKGTFEDLDLLKEIPADKNDYAFYDHVSNSNRVFDRYKYNGTEWVYEYTLNNSSFTDAQWKAINSGATAELINQILTNVTSINEILETLDIVDERLNNTVDKTSNQNIGGTKNFTSVPTVNNEQIALKREIIEGSGTIVTVGGEAQYEFNADTKLDKNANAVSATKATQDQYGLNIDTAYVRTYSSRGALSENGGSLNDLYKDSQDMRYVCTYLGLANKWTDKPEASTAGFVVETFPMRRSSTPYRSYMQKYSSRGGIWFRTATQETSADAPSWTNWEKVITNKYATFNTNVIIDNGNAWEHLQIKASNGAYRSINGNQNVMRFDIHDAGTDYDNRRYLDICSKAYRSDSDKSVYIQECTNGTYTSAIYLATQNWVNKVNTMTKGNTASTDQHDTVKEFWINSAGTEWYRIWRSGWKEWGMVLSNSSDTDNLSVTFANSFKFSTENYIIQTNLRGSSVTTTGGANATLVVRGCGLVHTQETTGFTFQALGRNYMLYACGL